MTTSLSVVKKATWLEVPDVFQEDPLEVYQKYELALKARDDFLRRVLSFSDYLEILSYCGVDVDDYVGTVSFNLDLNA